MHREGTHAAMHVCGAMRSLPFVVSRAPYTCPDILSIASYNCMYPPPGAAFPSSSRSGEGYLCMHEASRDAQFYKAIHRCGALVTGHGRSGEKGRSPRGKGDIFACVRARRARAIHHQAGRHARTHGGTIPIPFHMPYGARRSASPRTSTTTRTRPRSAVRAMACGERRLPAARATPLPLDRLQLEFLFFRVKGHCPSLT